MPSCGVLLGGGVRRSEGERDRRSLHECSSTTSRKKRSLLIFSTSIGIALMYISFQNIISV